MKSMALAGENPSGLNSAESLPLIVGVTGHRDLRGQDFPGLEEQVRRVFDQLRVGHSDAPLVLLSALAEGADRLAARVGLGDGVRLIAVLPMRRELYEWDFATEESRADFDTLLRAAERCVVMPPVAAATEAEFAEHGEARDRQYAQAGAYIVRHCQILIALWDGNSEAKTGGTAEVVRFKLDGAPEIYGPARRSALETAGDGAVYQIVTPRTSAPHPKGVAFSLTKHFGVSDPDEAQEAAKVNRRIYERVEIFNRDARRLSNPLAPLRRLSRNKLITDAESLPAVLRLLCERYATADALAVHFQTSVRRALIALLVLTFFTALFIKLATLAPERGLWSVLYLASLALAFACYRWAKRRDIQNKCQDYRALAEGLRVQFFWRLAGLQEAVADHYLQMQRAELTWILYAIRSWNGPLGETDGACSVAESDGADAFGRLQIVIKHWIEGQRDYFDRAARLAGRRLKWLERTSFALFTVALLWAVVEVLTKLLPQWFAALGSFATGTVAARSLNITLTLAPVIGALLLSYIQFSALAENSKQYARMLSLFANAKRAHVRTRITGRRDTRDGNHPGFRPRGLGRKRRLVDPASRAAVGEAESLMFTSVEADLEVYLAQLAIDLINQW